MDAFQKILWALDEEIEKENEKRISQDAFSYPMMEILLLGQMGLFAHPSQLQAKLHLVGTVDVDAKIQADHALFLRFRKILQQHGLEYDEDSHLIWVPPGSTQTRIFDTPRLLCDVLDPMYVLTSKAIKAREKNRILLAQALSLFGKPLSDLITQHGGDPEYFKG